MATTSITKSFVLKSDEACDKLIKVLSEPSKRQKKESSNKYEEGKKLLAQYYSR